MIALLVWAAAGAGVLIALVQIFTARRLDLRPLILGSLALVVVLGLLDVSVGIAGALNAVAQATPDLKTVLLARNISRAIHGILALAVGVGAVSGLGGVAIFLRDVVSQRAAPAVAPQPPTDPAPGV